MKDFIIYIGLSGICIGIFFLVYRLFLRPSTLFGFNRAFLLIGLVTSFVLPAMRFSYEVIVPVSISSFDVSATTQAVPVTMDIDIWVILSAIYITGIIIQVFRNLTAYRRMIKLTKSGTLTKTSSYKVVDSPQITSPFTILNCIAINTANMTEIEKDVILKHEITHISQKHWIDLLCSECALLLQWFNPLMWLYVSSLKENHEFLADKSVIEAGVSPAVYQATLINQRFQGPVFSFSNSFNYPNQLNRLFMIKKAKTSPWRKIAVLTLIPSFGLFFWASATPRYVFGGDRPMEVGSYSSDSINSGKALYIIDGKIKYSTGGDHPMMVSGNSTNPEKALYIIDGKESSIAEVDKLDPQKIETLSITEAKYATKSYGKRGKYGVLAITTKNGTDKVQFTPPVIEKDPLIIIDGKESNKEELDKLAPSTIDNMSVLKDKSAIEIYGEKGNSGVIIVTTKKGVTAPPPPPIIRVEGVKTDPSTHNNSNVYLVLENGKIVNNENDNLPLYFVDGKESNAKEFESISTNKIEKIEVFKGEDAIKKYGEKGKNGVIVITLKNNK